MASATPSQPSTKETSNYAQLCRLLVEVGSLMLRKIFDRVCPPENLHAVLTNPTNHAKLQTLRKERVLSTFQWGKLYPVSKTSVSSGNFDTSLLLFLLRNIFGLNFPASGRNNLPPGSDTSPEADITRIKFFRDRVFSHAANASVDDPTFSLYWNNIKDTFLRIGGTCYEEVIDDPTLHCMDADLEEHYQELLREWLKDDDRITDKVHEDKIVKKARKGGDMENSFDISEQNSWERETVLMPGENTSAENGNGSPPEFSVKLPKLCDLPAISSSWETVELPVDIVLLAVEDCEFLSCFAYLKEPFKSYHISTGPVYFGCMGDDQGKKMKIALMRCSKGPDVPQGSLSVSKDAISVLRPKAIFSVGACSGLNSKKVKLGDVVVSAKLITAVYKTPPSRDIGNLIKHVADGWKAPLQNADEYNAKVHCDGVVLSISEANRDMIRKHPEAIAVEMEGGGVYAAAHDFKTEWVVVKGIKDFVDETHSSSKKWNEIACVMAASVVANILNDPVIFQDWPHFNADSLSDLRDTTEKIEIEMKEVKETLCSLTTTVEKSTDEGSVEKMIGEMVKMDSELKEVKEKLCTLTASVGESKDEGTSLPSYMFTTGRQTEQEELPKTMRLQERKVPPEISARGPLAFEVYNNALAEGQACVKRVPLMIVGQDRSGKTSVKKSLKGICFNPDEDSTLGIEVDRYDFKVTTEIWKTGETGEEANIGTTVTSFERNAARWIADKLTTLQKTAEVKRASSAESTGYDFEEIGNTREKEPYETLSDATLLESSVNPASTNTTEDEPNLSTSEVQNPTELEPEEDLLTTTLEKLPDFDDVAKLLPQFLQENWDDDKEDIYSILWDFAGQSVYYVTHPLFLTRRAIYFLVYDLSRNPSDKATSLVKQGVYKEFIADKYNLKTNFDYLDFWMSSLASLVSDCQQVDPEKSVPLKKFPAVYLVCTHADQPYCDRDPFELACEIFGNLRSKPYGAHLREVFCVDNTKSGTESECKETIRLREAVHVVSKELPHVTEAIPIKWLRYENVLRVLKEKDHKFISLSTAKKIASKLCNINDNEVQTVLAFLHDLRFLIHFDDSPELSDFVYLDIQWLIDVFKNVITIRAYHEEKDFAPLWETLEKEGIVEEKLLKHVWNSLVPLDKTHKSLIAIMEKFSLMCLWPSSDDLCSERYLVPSMLRTLPPKQISDLVDSAKLPSLFLKFDTGRVPAGLFPRFMLEFFQWCRKEFPNVDLPQTYTNFARFYIFPIQGLSLVLLCHSSTIEVVVLGVKSAIDVVDVDSIRAFRSQLTSIIDRVWKKFFWVKKVGYKVSYLCPVCSYGRVARLCKQHNEEICEQEECLHFISESDLGDEKQAVCTNFVTALDNRIHAEQFAPWIFPGKEKMATHQHGGGPQLGKVGNSDGYQRKSPVLLSEAVATLQLQRPSVGGESDMLLAPFAQGNPGYCQVQPLVAEQFEEEFNQLQDAVNESKGTLAPLSEGYGEKSLALPHDVSQSLKSESVIAKDVVCKLLNLSSLKDPAPDDRKWIRCLMRDAKDCGRTDVVNFLRENAPAGTTGPRLEESLSVMNIPRKRRTDLAVRLCGGEEWKIVADQLGFEDAYIRCFDNRFKNPVELILSCSDLRVGKLYDLLVECGFPLLADLL